MTNMKKTFTLKNGTVLELRPIPQYLIDLKRTSRSIPPAPTYIVESVGGPVVVAMDEAYVNEHPEKLDEWKSYQEEAKKERVKSSMEFLKMLLLEGIEESSLPEKWLLKMKRYGIAINEDEEEARYQYLLTNIQDTDETLLLMEEILAVSITDPDAVAGIRKSFRANIQRNSSRRNTDKSRALENFDDIPGIGDSSLLETNPVRVLEQVDGRAQLHDSVLSGHSSNGSDNRRKTTKAKR